MMPPPSAITVERIGHITRITIQREARRNALDRCAQEQLSDALDEFSADRHQRVAILTGAGTKAFCAGHDLTTPTPSGVDGLLPNGFGGVTARFDLDKPLIAAVNGAAFGGGFEMVLACDIVIAAQTASFALPEVVVGVAAMGGGILRLARHLSHQQAMGIILTGRPVSADQALAMGFVNEVVCYDRLQATAMEWADSIVRASPMAVRASKWIALDCSEGTMRQANRDQWDLPTVRTAMRSGDWSEGPRAFTEKRKPRWQD